MSDPVTRIRSVTQLPVQVFPRPCEGVESFIARLAEANHLKPTVLRSYLCDPPGPRGTFSWPRLIAATGRSLSELQEVLERTPPPPSEQLLCDYCGRPPSPSRLPPGPPPWWCSTRCRRRAELLATAPSSRGILPDRREIVSCLGCGTQVIRTENSTRNTCSKRCLSLSSRLRDAELALYENPNAVEDEGPSLVD
ncbi:hypothetical protein ACWC5I_36370 [Kitasatospora sp. NPDC001574]